MAIRVADLPLYVDPLVGSERVLFESAAGTGLVAYPRLWKPATRQAVILSTVVLAFGAAESGLVVLSPVFEVLQVSLSVAARLRLYSSVAARTADAARSATTRAQAGSGLILEVKSGGALSQPCDPHAHGANFESVVSSNIPYVIQNLADSGSVTVIFTFIDRS